MTMLRLYRVLLRLYPARFVAECGEEMASVFDELQQGCRAEGFSARVRFGLREVSGMLAGALREQLYVRDRNLSGGTMRFFRFSRWTIVMMILIFCAVNTAIESGRMAAVQLSGGPFTSHWWTLPGVFMAVSVFLGGIGLLGYYVVHVLRGVRPDRGQ
ncbi:MAG TPA: hypothetical protein VK210_05060 [Terriglobia bacterium]|nr:hypothetical protein [Terriglobia bacterium]